MSARRGSTALAEMLKGKRSDSLKKDDGQHPHLDFELEEGVSYLVKYLGATPITDKLSVESLRAKLDVMKSKESKPCQLSISIRGLKVCDEKMKHVHFDHAVRSITIVTTQAEHFLAYVARDSSSSNSFSAHCFKSKKYPVDTIAADIARSFTLAAQYEQNPKDRVDPKIASMRRVSTVGSPRLTRQDFEPVAPTLPSPTCVSARPASTADTYYEQIHKSASDDQVYDVVDRKKSNPTPARPGHPPMAQGDYDRPSFPDYDKPVGHNLNYAEVAFPGTAALATMPGVGSIALRRLSAASTMRPHLPFRDGDREREAIKKSSSVDALESRVPQSPKSPRTHEVQPVAFTNTFADDYDSLPPQRSMSTDAQEVDEVYGTVIIRRSIEDLTRDSYDSLGSVPQSPSLPLRASIQEDESDAPSTYDALPPPQTPPTTSTSASAAAAAAAAIAATATQMLSPPALPSRLRRPTLDATSLKEHPPSIAVASGGVDHLQQPHVGRQDAAPASVAPSTGNLPAPSVFRASKPRLSVGSWDAPRLTIARANALKGEVCGTCRDHFTWVTCKQCSSEFPASAAFVYCGYCGVKLE